MVRSLYLNYDFYDTVDKKDKNVSAIDVKLLKECAFSDVGLSESWEHEALNEWVDEDDTKSGRQTKNNKSNQIRQILVTSLIGIPQLILECLWMIPNE